MMLSLIYSEACIPEGFYCYTHLKREYDENGMMFLRLILCPYFKHVWYRKFPHNTYCKFLRLGEWQGPYLLWDQVKECGVNEYTDEELEEMWDEEN